MRKIIAHCLSVCLGFLFVAPGITLSQALPDSIYCFSNQNASWVLSSSKHFEYDTDSSIIQEIHKVLNTQSGQLQFSEKILNTYDSEQRLTTMETYGWLEMEEEWTPQVKNTMVYNNLGDIILQLRQEWNSGDGTWENNYRTSNFYNQNDLLELKTQERWISFTHEWVYDNKTLHFHNINLLEDSLTFWIWDVDSSDWKPSSKKIFGYDADQNLSLESSLFASPNHNWRPFTQEFFTYLPNSQLLRVQLNLWNDSSMIHVPVSSIDYSYDAGREVLQWHKYFDPMIGWRDMSKYEKTYWQGIMTDLNVSQIDLVTGAWNPIYSLNYVLDSDLKVLESTEQQWDEESHQSLFSSYCEYYYDGIVSKEVEVTASAFTIPNPLIPDEASLIMADNTLLRIINMDGRLLHEKTYLEGEEFNVPDYISRGHYLISLQNLSSGHYTIHKSLIIK